MRGMCLLALLITAGLTFSPVHGVGPNNALNDTGIVLYGDDGSNTLTSAPATHPGQDGSYGRDAAARAGILNKQGGGSKGFDFTKISNVGNGLPASATVGAGPNDWACTYDNVTGLMWEVKVDDANHLRYSGWRYTWYGNAAGAQGNCQTSGRCQTELFVQDVNAVGLCGRNDWRMPTIKELESIVDYDVYPGPTIDTSYFPNTVADRFWSGTRYPIDPLFVHFATGGVSILNSFLPFRVRLVRPGQ